MCGLSCVQYVEFTTLISLITHPMMNPKAQVYVHMEWVFTGIKYNNIILECERGQWSTMIYGVVSYESQCQPLGMQKA